MIDKIIPRLRGLLWCLWIDGEPCRRFDPERIHDVLAQHPLQSNLLRYMLVGSRFLFVRLFPALQIPNFKTPTIAYERDFIF